MESYFRKSHNLKAGEKDMSVSRTASPQPVNRSRSVDPKVRDEVLTERHEAKKVAYQTDVQECVKKVNEVKDAVEEVKKCIKDHQEDVVVRVDELHKQIGNVKQDNEQTKSERMKQKLDDFITKYNDNEKAHSDAMVTIEKCVKEVDERLEAVENVL